MDINWYIEEFLKFIEKKGLREEIEGYISEACGYKVNLKTYLENAYNHKYAYEYKEREPIRDLSKPKTPLSFCFNWAHTKRLPSFWYYLNQQWIEHISTIKPENQYD